MRGRASPSMRLSMNRASKALLTLATGALTAEVVLVALGSASSGVAVRNALVVTVILLAALVTLISGATRPAGTRAPWLVLGIGMLSYTCAFVSLFFLQPVLTTFPSPADFFWLAFYPLVI